MTTELALSAVFGSPAHSHAISGLIGDAVVAIAPMVAALGDIVALMELGQSAAIFLGLLLMTYGAATLSHKRAAVDRAKPYPGIRGVTAAWCISPLDVQCSHYCIGTWPDRPSRMRWKWIN